MRCNIEYTLNRRCIPTWLQTVRFKTCVIEHVNNMCNWKHHFATAAITQTDVKPNTEKQNKRRRTQMQNINIRVGNNHAVNYALYDLYHIAALSDFLLLGALYKLTLLLLGLLLLLLLLYWATTTISSLLCSCPNRSHYGSHPSVRPSLRLSLPDRLLTRRTKQREEGQNCCKWNYRAGNVKVDISLKLKISKATCV